MPISKCPQKSEPLWKGWDQKAQKNGLRHQVYAVNGDCYVGEWKDNMKHGEWGTLGGSSGERGLWTRSQGPKSQDIRRVSEAPSKGRMMTWIIQGPPHAAGSGKEFGPDFR